MCHSLDTALYVFGFLTLAADGMKSTHKYSAVRKWRHLAHLVRVYLMPVASGAPALSQSSSRACSPAADSPLSQTAAATTAINYSPELWLLVYLWGL